MSLLGQYLRNTREEKKLSMGDVAKGTSITTTRLNRIEHGSVDEPSPSALKQLADYYNISIVDLFIKAGYLTADALNVCPQIFSGIEKLTDDDRKHIQQQIDYLIIKHI